MHGASIRHEGRRDANCATGLVALTGVMLSAGLVTLALLPHSAGIWISLLVVGAVFPLLWLILPRRYEVWPDSLRIVFPLWRWRIAYDGIERVETSKVWSPTASGASVSPPTPRKQ